MRDVKFRAWHKYEGMTTPYAYLNESNGFNQAHVSKPVAVMQYTGMKDSSGADIYEDDLVRVTDSEDPYVNWVGIVRYGVRGYPAFDLYDNEYGTLSNEYNTLTNDDLTLTVIGNIHENPELMEA